jgi:DNA repair exonuclease SbcCD ATPase subunit
VGISVVFCAVLLLAGIIIAAICAHNHTVNKRQELVEKAVEWRSKLGEELDKLKKDFATFKEALCASHLPTSAIVAPYGILDDVRTYLRAVDRKDISKLDEWLQNFGRMKSVRSMQQALNACQNDYSIHFESIKAAKKEMKDAIETLNAQKQHYRADAAEKRIEEAQSHTYTLMILITQYGQVQHLPEDLRMLRGQLLRELSVTVEYANDCKEWGHVALDDFEKRVNAMQEACQKFIQAGVGKTHPRLPWLQGVDLDNTRQLSSYPVDRALVGVSYN